MANGKWQMAKNVFAVLHWKIPALLGPRPVARLTEAKSPDILAQLWLIATCQLLTALHQKFFCPPRDRMLHFF